MVDSDYNVKLESLLMGVIHLAAEVTAQEASSRPLGT